MKTQKEDRKSVKEKIKRGRKDTKARERQKDNERKRQEAVITVMLQP
jgi:hypothetical protein